MLLNGASVDYASLPLPWYNRAMHTHTLTKHCAVCGKIFSKPTVCSMTEWVNQRKFCSRSCYWIAKKKVLDRPCANCGKAMPYNSSNPKQRFCSYECSSASQRKPLPLCEMCGETCHRTTRRFCSRECKVAWYRGDNVYNYAGGQARDHYASSFWMERAQLVRERDKVCQHCGVSPDQAGTLHVHHIIPWRFSHDDSLENLIALCSSCHKKADAIIEHNGKE